ncbi:hypothetical protein BN7_938 [Wickerhamomyces ciferrii]|uniref:Uncharacterized protein n=1 Tax=Wickerhamomyces ciferrii (strain ATCC 14091 / BCRC 22168 / CBS 111 / JCM 3599 / NBRC 0793 / NRRL Y-1031 F-60-10) TaxID=1206466 RepID=K0KGT9_WICCF|nr:uncharacterized protein BN7_938 [Wickerhamomyces ciferrii]CCH41397.1 hypothetical protein BN7_938 [Wickerhamomyces ciferrii]
MTQDEPTQFYERSRICHLRHDGVSNHEYTRYKPAETIFAKGGLNQVSTTKHIGNLPLEIIDLIRIFVNEDDPKSNLKYFTVCKSFYFIFRKALYESINIIVGHEGVHFELRPKEKLNKTMGDSLHINYNQRTLVTNLSKGLQFLKLIESREDLRSLVENLHIGGLNMNIHSDYLSSSIRQKMTSERFNPNKEKKATIFQSEVHKFILLRKNVKCFLSELISQTTQNFHTYRNFIPNIKTYTNNKRNFYTKEEVLSSLMDPESSKYQCVDRLRVPSMLFQPYKGFDYDLHDSMIFLEFLNHALYVITKLPFKSSSLSVLNYANKQLESYYGGKSDSFDHSIAFLTFNFYFICPETSSNIKEFQKTFNTF